VSTLWGVGCYDDEQGRRAPWRISPDEINRDIGSATRVLQGLDVSGTGVLWCSMLANAGQFWPYICGTVLAGGRLSCADATKGEAVRVAMFLRLMPYVAVFGVTSAILDGLDELDAPYLEVFENVRIVGAYADAHERLHNAGVDASHFALCGPALALAAEPGAPARVAADEWELSGAGVGRVCVTARNERAQEFERTPVGVRGEIVDGGIMPWPDR
jgi:hypothetical protein